MNKKLDTIYNFVFKEKAPDGWSDSLKLLTINLYLESEIKIEQELEKLGVNYGKRTYSTINRIV